MSDDGYLGEEYILAFISDSGRVRPLEPNDEFYFSVGGDPIYLDFSGTPRIATEGSIQFPSVMVKKSKELEQPYVPRKTYLH